MARQPELLFKHSAPLSRQLSGWNDDRNSQVRVLGSKTSDGRESHHGLSCAGRRFYYAATARLLPFLERLELPLAELLAQTDLRQ